MVSDAENMTDAQVDEIKAAKEKLMESAQKLFAKLYEVTAGCWWCRQTEQVQVLIWELVLVLDAGAAGAHLTVMMLLMVITRKL